MSAPLKPWERVGVNSQTYGNVPLNAMSSEPPLTSAGLSGGVVGSSPGLAVRSTPPVPPRPTQQNALSGYSGNSLMGDYGGGGGGMYGGGYSPYGGYGSRLYGGYSGGYGGGYGGYGSSLGGYGSSFNRFGMNNSNVPPNSFVRAAEESSRQAFQSVESIVQAFGSVAMMLESTFQAVYNSFQAVLGVADHFSRMKATFKQVFSALAIWRMFRWLYRKLLVLLRLRSAGLNDDVWDSAMTPVGMDGDGAPKKSNWPLMLFLAIAVGGPWLIWKILNSVSGAETDENGWMDGSADHFVAVAEYDFSGQTDEEVTFRKGQKVIIAPKELQPRMRGWLLGSVNGKKSGILPANHVKILGKQKGKRHAVNKPNTHAATEKQLPSARPMPQKEDLNTVYESSTSSSMNNELSYNTNGTEAELDNVYGGSIANTPSGESSDFKTAEDILEEKTDFKNQT